MADKPDAPDPSDQPTAAAAHQPATGAQPTVELPQSSQPEEEPASPAPSDGEPAPGLDQPARSAAGGEQAPGPDQPARPAAGGESAPGSDQPAAEAPPVRSETEAPPQPPVSPPAPKRPPRMVKTWIAAVAAGLLLLGGGVAGYAIGATDRHDRPGWSDGRGPGGEMHWRGGGHDNWGDRGDRGSWDR